MRLQENIRRILKEETYGMSSLESAVSDLVNSNLQNLPDNFLPDNFLRIAVDIYKDEYDRTRCQLTALFKKPFSGVDSERASLILRKERDIINGYFGDSFDNISNGTSTVEVYDDYKSFYDDRK